MAALVFSDPPLGDETSPQEDASNAAAAAAVGGGAAAPPGASDAQASRLSFRNWLLNGGGLYGVSGERQSGKRRPRKKARAHDDPKTGNPLAPGMPSMEARQVSSGGKKKTRRWLNDLLLRELAGPLDASDVASLYAPPPWGAKTHRPALERITEISPWHAERLDRPLWDLILSSDMDQRDRVLRASQRSSLPAGAGVTPGSLDAGRAAVQAWRRVSPQAKEALKRSWDWAMVGLLEDRLLLLKLGALQGDTAAASPAKPCAVSEPALPGHVTAESPVPSGKDRALPEGKTQLLGGHPPAHSEPPEVPHAVSEPASDHAASSAREATTTRTLEGEGPKKGLQLAAHETAPQASPAPEFGTETKDKRVTPTAAVLGADDSYVRLIIHGLCQFHSLLSCSLSVPEAKEHTKGLVLDSGCSDWDGSERVVVVSIDPGGSRVLAHACYRLADVLATAR